MMTTPAGSRLPTPPRLMIPSESEPVDHMSVHDSYPPRARSPSSEPPEFFNHHPHRDPFAHEPSSPLDFPRRPSYLRNSAATCDSELTRIGSESWLHASGSVIASVLSSQLICSLLFFVCLFVCSTLTHSRWLT
jgi:hypothetical protein